MVSRMMIVALLGLMPFAALAQDVPGIEICTAEKSMERRTGCLQSNINFLMQRMSKLSLENQQKLDAANRQIDALKAALAGLQKKVDDLQAAREAAGKDKPKELPKDAPPAK